MSEFYTKHIKPRAAPAAFAVGLCLAALKDAGDVWGYLLNLSVLGLIGIPIFLIFTRFRTK